MLGRLWTWPLGGLKSPPSSGSPSVASCACRSLCSAHGVGASEPPALPAARLPSGAPDITEQRDSKLAVSFLNSPPTKEGGIVTINNYFKSLGVGIICDTAIGECDREHCYLRYGLPFCFPLPTQTTHSAPLQARQPEVPQECVPAGSPGSLGMHGGPYGRRKCADSWWND